MNAQLNGVTGGSGNPIARRGCLLGIILAVVMISGLAYMWLSTFKDMLPPPELQSYSTMEGTVKLVRSHAPAPGPEVRLTQENVGFYLGALDSVNAEWEKMLSQFDSTVKAQGKKIDLIRSFEDFKGMIHLPFYTRRSLVNYLNGQGKSLDEYLWAKKRIVAASGITQQEAHAALRNLYGKYFELEEEEKAMSEIRQGSDQFYKDVEALRKNGIDSTERALVAPYRETLLSKGLHSLMGIETMFPK